ncbi:hypothetical protein IFM89_034333 [Coptis chinensis]|uniref:Uncharacterized protein n=1 Tax=Coptis chinensis TaxID=261450 RepID=A0A835M5I6_9MAGN|nr:hypothetical protein IFM89_034333 [Coptis chinensis]
MLLDRRIAFVALRNSLYLLPLEYVAYDLLYLSNVSHGGEILFRKLESKNSQPKEDTWSECARTGYVVKPLKGNTLLFFNVQPNTAPNENISNARCPVLQGEKWCAINALMKKIVVQSGLPKENAIGIPWVLKPIAVTSSNTTLNSFLYLAKLPFTVSPSMRFKTSYWGNPLGV